jgi:hypothetical protein
MPSQDLFLLNFGIISVFQIYLMVSYSIRKSPGKSFAHLLIYSVIVSFLLYVHYKNISIPGFIITCSVIAVIGHTFLGTFLDFYHKSKYFDRYLHLFGSFSFALLSFSLDELSSQVRHFV